MKEDVLNLKRYLQRIIAAQLNAKRAARCGEHLRPSEDLDGFIRNRHNIPAASSPEGVLCHLTIARRLDSLERLKFLLKCFNIRLRVEWENRRDVPSLYRVSVRERLPDVTAFDHTLSRCEEANGITLWGPTGSGKSRALFAAARITALSLSDVGIVSPAQIKRASIKPADWSQMLLGLLEYDVLLVDDLSHARFSEAYAAALLELVEAATSNGSPRLFITVQCTGKELIRKWCGNDHDLQPTAAAIARRIGPEFADCIEFSLSPRPRGRVESIELKH